MAAILDLTTFLPSIWELYPFNSLAVFWVDCYETCKITSFVLYADSVYVINSSIEWEDSFTKGSL